MPDFARDYFRAIEPTTSPKTRISYAYDIRLFFQFLIEENPVYKHHSIKDFQVQDLEASVHCHESDAFSRYAKASRQGDYTFGY